MEINGKQVIKEAQKRGADIRQGKADHVIIIWSGGSQMSVPNKVIKSDLAYKISKWITITGLGAFILYILLGLQ